MRDANMKKLLEEVETLASLFIGKGAEGERWDKTLDRIDRMGKLAKKIRAAEATRGK